MSALFGRLFMRLKNHLLSICLLILHLGSKNQSKKEEIFGREPSSIYVALNLTGTLMSTPY